MPNIKIINAGIKKVKLGHATDIQDCGFDDSTQSLQANGNTVF
jgi:hypothetical protein